MNLISHGSQMYQNSDLIVNVYICLSFKIFIMVKLKGIKSLGVKTRTWFFEHSKKQSIQMKIYQNSLYILIKAFYTNPLNIVITLRNHHLLNLWVQRVMLMIMQWLKAFFGTLKCETIYLQKFESLADLIRTIDEYIYWYNHERIKLTLGGYSPIQYRFMNQ